MNFFFIGAIRGGRAKQPQFKTIVELLKQHGTLLSDHVADETMPQHGETDLTKEEIYAREMDHVNRCDVVVAEVTTPSLGVGYLIAEGLHAGKRIVCLYNGEDTYLLSAMIKGDPRIEIYPYQSTEELGEICARIFHH
jgi:2'-deoxynucleoside 5'-phosphate N-hydrolase